ncbi:MAG TPA: HEAT repeat domain-containing protein [Candidatus Obscuribacterales bacterium]
MNVKTTSGFLSPIVRLVKRFAAALKERPTVSADEYETEHILLYHGLVGSHQENQPEFRDVRADIRQAIANRSSVELCIALKLPPLWWDDRLRSIIAELDGEQRQIALGLLYPERLDGQAAVPGDPLQHADWRVRANAAGLLAELGARQSVGRLVSALEQAAGRDGKPAFCHIAYALARLGTPEARRKLLSYLDNDDPWVRVDAARALALWPQDHVAADLTQAMLARHALSDYMAVVIARQHNPCELLANADESVRQGALEIVVGVLEAAAQTFSQDIVIETQTHRAWPSVWQIYRQHRQPRQLRAALKLALWLKEHEEFWRGEPTLAELPEHLEQALSELTGAEAKKTVLEELAHLSGSPPEARARAPESQLRHALQLAGELKEREAVPLILPLLKQDEPLLEEAIDALGRLGDERAAEPLVKLAMTMVSPEDRNTGERSKYPVVEEDAQAARRYWLILRSLGAMPATAESVSLLLKATHDLSADKREQALLSLVGALSATTTVAAGAEVIAAIEAGLHDPCVPVRMAALNAVAQFQLTSELPVVVRLTDAKEVSLRNKAFATLSSLAEANAGAVAAAVAAKAKLELDPNRRQRLDTFLATLASTGK